jgi:hypothetical protein
LAELPQVAEIISQGVRREVALDTQMLAILAYQIFHGAPLLLKRFLV